jgi:uncharacterized tellurite resistance protein B-like protein
VEEKIQKLAAAVIFSDGEISPNEVQYLEVLAEKFKIDKSKISTAVEKEIQELIKMDDEEFHNYIEKATTGISDYEIRKSIFNCLMELAIIDGLLDDLETSILGTISKHLEIPVHYLVNNIAYLVKKNNVEVVSEYNLSNK